MSKLQSNKPTDRLEWVPKAVAEMTPVTRTSKSGAQYTKWTESWFKSQVKGGFRELFHQWPRRKEVLERVRVVEPTLTKKGLPSKRPTVWYICESCGAKCKVTVAKTNPKGYKRIWVDHKEPVVPLDREIGLAELLDRIFCDPSNLQALCDDCHKEKTSSERKERARIRREKKNAHISRRREE